MRAGERHALRWRHLDLADGAVTIETRVDSYGEEDVTKSGAGMRTVPPGAAVVAALKEWRVRAKRSKTDDLVFSNRRGWYENQGNMVRRRFNPLFEKLGELHKKDPATPAAGAHAI